MSGGGREQVIKLDEKLLAAAITYLVLAAALTHLIANWSNREVEWSEDTST